MNVIALRPALVEMLLALHVHEIEFIHKSMPLQQLESAIDGNTIDSGIELARMAENLRRIQVLLGILNYAQNCAPLAR